MTRRVIIGRHNNGNFGLYVSMPGVDAYVSNTQDRDIYSFSSDWSDSMSFVMSGQAGVNSWVSIPSYVDFWPAIHFDMVNSGTSYYQNRIYYAQGSTWFVSQTAYWLEYQWAGIRQFRIASNVYGGTARYIVTTLRVA